MILISSTSPDNQAQQLILKIFDASSHCHQFVLLTPETVHSYPLADTLRGFFQLLSLA